MHLSSECLPPNQRDMFEKQGYYIESFFLGGENVLENQRT